MCVSRDGAARRGPRGDGEPVRARSPHPVRPTPGKSRDALRQGTTVFPTPPDADGRAPAAPLLRAERLQRGQKLRSVSLEVRTGEIVGLAGLLGSGLGSTARALSGLDLLVPALSIFASRGSTRGRSRVAGDRGRNRVPVRGPQGGSYKIETELSVRENLMLAALPTLTGSASSRAPARWQSWTGSWRASGSRQPARIKRSGSSREEIQQKVLLARLLCTLLPC